MTCVGARGAGGFRDEVTPAGRGGYLVIPLVEHLSPFLVDVRALGAEAPLHAPESPSEGEE